MIRKILIFLSSYALLQTVVIVVLCMALNSKYTPEPLPEEPEPYIYSRFTEGSGKYIVNSVLLTMDDTYNNGFLISIDNRPFDTYSTEDEAYQVLNSLLNYYQRESRK